MGLFPLVLVPKAIVSRVATVNEKNEPNCTPVWSVFDGKKIYFATDPGTQKLYNLKRNRNIAIAYDDYDKKNWKKVSGVMFRGTAKVLKKGEEYMHAYKLLQRKYPEYREEPWEEGEVPIIAITPKRMYRWGYRYDTRSRDYVEITKDGRFKPL